MSVQAGDEKAGENFAERLAKNLQVIRYAVSLGHHRSLVWWMPTSGMVDTSFRLEGGQLESNLSYAGDGIMRLSVGLEYLEDLIADLERVLV